MRETINFEEDLYFLNELFNALEGGISLKIDQQYFFDKIVEDIFFLDATINKIYAALYENYTIMQVPQILRSLQTTKNRFIALLQLIISGSSGLSDAFIPFMEKLNELIHNHTQDVHQIRENYLGEQSISTPREGISPEEYHFLFPEDDEQS